MILVFFLEIKNMSIMGEKLTYLSWVVKDCYRSTGHTAGLHMTTAAAGRGRATLCPSWRNMVSRADGALQQVMLLP